MKLTPSEQFALEQWLSEYPNDMSYDEIIEHIAGDFDNPDILVWGVLMGYSQDRIVDTIENTKSAFENIVNIYYTPKEQN